MLTWPFLVPDIALQKGSGPAPPSQEGVVSANGSSYAVIAAVAASAVNVAVLVGFALHWVRRRRAKRVEDEDNLAFVPDAPDAGHFQRGASGRSLHSVSSVDSAEMT